MRKDATVRWTTLLLVPLLFAGCAFSPTSPLPMGEQIDRLFSLKRWEARAKFSSRVEGENYRGSVRMKHYPNSYSLAFSGPLGFGLRTLRGYWQDDMVHITQKQGTDIVALEDIGLPHPKVLRRWMLGRPTADGQNVQQDHAGRNLGFQDIGWEVRYLEYSLVKGIWLPVRIRLKGPSASTALIAIYAWKLKG